MIRVDYAGPGGACEGLRTLGLTPVGIEWDAAACATRAAAGHLTIRADLATYRPHHRPGTVEGYWSSPPCQTFSSAGKGDGRDQLDDLAAVIHAERWTEADLFDPRTRHVIDAAHTAVELAPGWVAMEQVPAVLPLWRALAHVLERHGYSTWCGVLCAADYGVPQTRRRAILMASRVGAVSPPVPTHAERPGMFGERPWVTMADALGWRLTKRPAYTLCGGNEGGLDLAGGSGAREGIKSAKATGAWLDRRQQSDGVPVRLVPTSEPAPTLTGQAVGQWVVRDSDGDIASGFTLADALAIQGFPADYPVQGGTVSEKGQQVGNAVPPPLAAHIVAALTGAQVLRAAS